MIGPALHVGPAGVTGPDGAPPRPADDPETGGGLRAYIRNPEGIATTARPLPPKKFFVPVGDKIGRKRPTFGTAAKTVL